MFFFPVYFILTSSLPFSKEATEQIEGVSDSVQLHYQLLKAAKKAYRITQLDGKVKVRYSKKEMLDFQDTAELERQREAAQCGVVAVYYSSD